MDRHVRPAFSAEDLVGAVREDLVDVHVVRRPGACLIHVHHEMLEVLAGENFIRRLHDHIGDLWIESAGFLVGQRRRALDHYGRPDEGGKRRHSADRKVLDGAQRLHSVQRVRRNFELSERVLLGASLFAHRVCV